MKPRSSSPSFLFSLFLLIAAVEVQYHSSAVHAVATETAVDSLLQPGPLHCWLTVTTGTQFFHSVWAGKSYHPCSELGGRAPFLWSSITCFSNTVPVLCNHVFTFMEVRMQREFIFISLHAQYFLDTAYRSVHIVFPIYRAPTQMQGQIQCSTLGAVTGWLPSFSRLHWSSCKLPTYSWNTPLEIKLATLWFLIFSLRSNRLPRCSYSLALFDLL